ncbi:Alpha/Beta hydrolase protein [Mucor mucedo]|uniref:Alpha/Beta hydrolase protein n=1 Tax=Mucor mucedo TaxID=29922 RepID=UPI0022206B6D|nr:Alpha/Beta hydrolase protein [Mucor mucedo]KAI7893641.1 Alpha/Beta hydrolase protein [Mucor mucedo]
MITKFTIPELDQNELQERLSNARYPNELQDDYTGWKFGSPTWAVKDMVDYWKSGFSWEKSRDEINRWHHYQTPINDLNIHFIHEPSSRPSSIPLVLLHGWPSTFYEFHKIIEPLRDHPTQAFHVVVPSLPGYGFSEAPKKYGTGGVAAFADVTHQLMQKLGYHKYMIYGTDWGSAIGSRLAQDHPDHVLGYFTNMMIAGPPLPTLQNIFKHPLKVLKFMLSIVLGFGYIYGADFAPLANFSFANVEKYEGAAYRAIQGMRPYTLAYGLTDSPVGLLGWMLEPYHVWTFHTAEEETQNIPDTITRDEFLTQVTLYWLTNSMSSSIRIYYEAMREMGKAPKMDIRVPLGVCYFKNEAFKFPRDWIEASATKLIQFKTFSTGGHFPALEETDHLLGEIQRFGVAVSKQTQKSKDI